MKPAHWSVAAMGWRSEGCSSPSSQFSLEPNTSKLGFSVLNWHLARWGYRLNDGKWATPTILDMGFRLIPRQDFLALLDKDAGQGGKDGRWTVEASPEIVAGWNAGRAEDRGCSPALTREFQRGPC